ncbi:MAG TPA: CocE/NonD family hydrolase C-terminal non-catalytic domain-containing protein, partial [Candidatus Thermoplasmatota archaeon]|nr:CocE/NonD family hydrolase C-terminal non-catalytic domain-containing protein [Candidatus Thermoplasmatota archaeon]
TVDRPEGQLSAYVYEVDASGDYELVSMGWLDLRLRESRDEAKPVPVGEPMQVRIPMLAIAQHVEKGHRIVVALAPENYATLTPRPQATGFTVALGGEGGARMVLPVFGGT